MNALGYTIAGDGRSITCRRCGRTSHNPSDVLHRYCGSCHVFHEGHQMSESKRRRQYEALPPKDRLGDAPIEAALHDKMNAMAGALDDLFNGDAKGPDRMVGFVVMVFPFGSADGRCNYISNGANRKDIVTLMREMIARFEGGSEQSGSA